MRKKNLEVEKGSQYPNLIGYEQIILMQKTKKTK